MSNVCCIVYVTTTVVEFDDIKGCFPESFNGFVGINNRASDKYPSIESKTGIMGDHEDTDELPTRVELF